MRTFVDQTSSNGITFTSYQVQGEPVKDLARVVTTDSLVEFVLEGASMSREALLGGRIRQCGPAAGGACGLGLGAFAPMHCSAELDGGGELYLECHRASTTTDDASDRTFDTCTEIA